MKKKKHYSNPHNTVHSLSVAGYKALRTYRNEVDEDSERIRQDYQRQLTEKAGDYWKRTLAVSGLVYREMTGDNKKTERFLMRLAEVLQDTKDRNVPTSDLVAELERVTGIEIEVQDNEIT